MKYIYLTMAWLFSCVLLNGATNAVSSSEPKGTRADTITFEAEDGVISGLRVEADPKAEARRYLVGSAKGGTAMYDFSVAESGTYKILGRLLCTDTSDGMLVKVDDGPEVRWRPGMAEKWAWREVAVNEVAEPYHIPLSKGNHTLIIRNLGLSCKLEALRLSPVKLDERSRLLDFVRGGQFSDLILPMPIIGEDLVAEGIWGNEHALPRDIAAGLEHQDWHFWGGNPIKGKDGRYHIAVCRWPVRESGSFHGWPKSHTAHYVSDSPMGPYSFTSIIVSKMHNPEVIRLPDGRFSLQGMNNDVYHSDRMAGPWKRVGRARLVTRSLRRNRHMGSNVTRALRPDGSFLAMLKNGDIAISRNGELGPYNVVSAQNYDNGTGYAEDPVVWRSRHQYHALYNHVQSGPRSCHMRSLDGIHWKHEYGYGYRQVADYYYEDGRKNRWYNMERPKVLQDDLGRALYISFGVADVEKVHAHAPEHGTKNLIMPLVKERIVSILSPTRVDADTKTIEVVIESEDSFDPAVDLDIPSLRFGSASLVDYGGGCEPVATKKKADGQLVVTFSGNNGMTHHDYDFKLLGKTKRGSLVIGYALLPQKPALPASLIALPCSVEAVDEQKRLSCVVENAGLSASEATHVRLYEYSQKGRALLRKVEIPALKPYESTTITYDLEGVPSGPRQYELLIAGMPGDYWKMVDIDAPSVKFTGSWQDNPNPRRECFLGSEKISSAYGNAVTFTFTGTRGIAYGQISRKHNGTAAIFIDGEYLESVACRYQDMSHEIIYQTPVLANGVHTLEIRHVEGELNGQIGIDSFAFESLDNAFQ